MKNETIKLTGKPSSNFITGETDQKLMNLVSNHFNKWGTSYVLLPTTKQPKGMG